MPKLSIVIATKGREYYCIKSLETILSIIDEDTEIIISDNSDTDKIAQYIAKINDNRLKYHFTPGAFTMSENYNIAMSLASGTYICMIGDDDIILPSIYDALKYADENKIDCVTQSKVINYIWPNDNCRGTIYLPNFTRKITQINFKENLNTYFKLGACVNPRDLKLPGLYHGLLKKSILDTIKNNQDEYIKAISPDSYLAVLLSMYIQSQVEVDFPFTIGGACKQSATIANMRGSHFGELEKSDQYLREYKKGYIWHKMVPKFYSIQTIWADSALHANDDSDLISNFSLEQLTARAIVENRRNLKMIISQTKQCAKYNDMSISLFLTITQSLKLFYGKILSRLINKQKKDFDIIENIGEIRNVISYIPSN